MTTIKKEASWKRRVALALLEARLPTPGIVRPIIRVLYRVGVWMTDGIPAILKFVWIEPVMRSVCAAVGKGFSAERLPYIRGKGRLRLGDHIRLSGLSSFHFMRNDNAIPEIMIGDRVFIGHGCAFCIAERIQIGNDCLIAGGVSIRDNDGHPLDPVRRREGCRMDSTNIKPVIIGSGVWIASRAIILKGVEIGDDAIVGAGSVVTQNVPAGSIVAGNPARIVRASPD